MIFQSNTSLQVESFLEGDLEGRYQGCSYGET